MILKKFDNKTHMETEKKHLEMCLGPVWVLFVFLFPCLFHGHETRHLERWKMPEATQSRGTVANVNGLDLDVCLRRLSGGGTLLPDAQAVRMDVLEKVIFCGGFDEVFLKCQDFVLHN